MKIRLNPTIFSELHHSDMVCDTGFFTDEFDCDHKNDIEHFTLSSDGTYTYAIPGNPEVGCYCWSGITWEELLYMVEGRYTVIEDSPSEVEDTSSEVKLKLGSKMKEIALPVCLSKEEQMVLIQKLMEDSVIFTLHHEWEEKVEIIIPLYNVQKTFNLLSLRMDEFDTYMKDIYDETVETTYGWENTLRKSAYTNSPTLCPFCGDTNISSGPIEADSSIALARVQCLACGREWTDTYKLINYKEEEL